jgi:O-antigen ligase
MRVVNFLSDPLSQESTQLRLTLFRDTLSQINISPITGSAFVELNSQQYPHNLFIESALAVGIPLSCLFVALIVKGTVEAWKSLNNGRALLGLLFFQSLIVAMVSGALFGATMLWLTLALLLYKQKF